MADKLFVQPIEQLFKRMSEEEKAAQLFGIPRSLFFEPDTSGIFRMERYGRVLETPLGVASGPHTQMTQNIIAAWLTGARYIELKTVQTLDELQVSKPCIDLEDEGYNCEWSQELKLLQSYDQYLNAWILVHLLRHKWGWHHLHPDLGCLFNMSVGYNMEGLLKPNVQEFLDKMENCRQEKEEKLARLAHLYPAVRDLQIPNQISNHMTLSTMHGCPPEEIEKIGLYLIEKRGYHTTIKLNPTLLGPARLREILNNRLGYQTHVPDQAFDHDLKYDDALSLIRSLQAAAKKKGVAFGLKLTNTLESVNHRQVFPPQETMMYMSGRALHPISIQVAVLLQREFKGDLSLSFSAGVDSFNVAPVLASGIRPVTVCSDLLKPGGYGRLRQYLHQLKQSMAGVDAHSLEDLIKNTHTSHGAGVDLNTAALENLEAYAAQVLQNPRYQKKVATGHSIKIQRPLTAFDCVEAPCVATCPAHQAIPDYMALTAAGNYREALATILNTNPFPTVTGMVCDHLCMTACTRVNYDEPLRIREIKRFIASQVESGPFWVPAPPKGITVAVIGAGPAGLACAYFLALQGVKVEVYEAQNLPGGMVASVIPAFRLSEEDLRKDIARIEKLGVTIFYNTRVDRNRFKELRQRCDFVYVAVGASAPSRLHIEGETLPGVTDALTFLARVRSGEAVTLGQRVAIIGGGNSAVDAARTAWRMAKNRDAQITMLYRRSRTEMPAEPEEIVALLEEGIKLQELTNPIKITSSNNGLTVLCARMEMGEPDESGRRRPLRIEGADFELHFDAVIVAVGQQVVLDLLDEPMTPCPPAVFINELGRIQNVFFGGDALHGAFNIITAIADGQKAAAAMLNLPPSQLTKKIPREIPLSWYQHRSAIRQFGPPIPELPVSQRQNFQKVVLSMDETSAKQEAERCLLCGDVCQICVTVCPNRANFAYAVPSLHFHLQKISCLQGKVVTEEDGDLFINQPYQVLNIADFCNECGNCATFCPTAGAPYRDKPKLCLSEAAFNAEENAFHFYTHQNRPAIKRKSTDSSQSVLETLTEQPDGFLYQAHGVLLKLDREHFRVVGVLEKPENWAGEIHLKSAAEMSVILRWATWLQPTPNKD